MADGHKAVAARPSSSPNFPFRNSLFVAPLCRDDSLATIRSPIIPHFLSDNCCYHWLLYLIASPAARKVFIFHVLANSRVFLGFFPVHRGYESSSRRVGIE